MMRLSLVNRRRGVVAMIVGFSLAAAFAACSDKNRIPSDVLGRDEMQAVMWDMIQADRYAAMFFPSDSIRKKDIRNETFKVYEQVFQIHNITREEFIKSYKFYLSRPDISKVMFDSIASYANRKREEEANERMREQQKKDSLLNVRMRDSAALRLKRDSALGRTNKDSARNRLGRDSAEFRRRKDSVLTRLRQRAQERHRKPALVP